MLDVDVNNFDRLRIGLASSEQIRQWSRGEVKKPETINYRTLKPEKDGLFCEKIFGPTKDWECYCGKYKRVRFKGIICERCGVEVTRAKVRRDRMGHIELAAPVSHIWYFKGVPSRLGYLLDVAPKDLEKVLYFASYVVTQLDTEARDSEFDEIRTDLYEELLDVARDAMGNCVAASVDLLRRASVLNWRGLGIVKKRAGVETALAGVAKAGEERDKAAKALAEAKKAAKAAKADKAEGAKKKTKDPVAGAEAVLERAEAGVAAAQEKLDAAQASLTEATEKLQSQLAPLREKAMGTLRSVADELHVFLDGPHYKTGYAVTEAWPDTADIETNPFDEFTDEDIEDLVGDYDAQEYSVEQALKAAEKEWTSECRDIAEEAQEVGAVLQKALYTFEHMKLKDLVSDEGLYRMMVEKWGWSKDKEERKRKSPEIEVKWYFRGGMGAEAIKDLLKQVDLDELGAELRTQIREGKGQKKQKAIKRLKVVSAFRQSKNRPEWMILDAIPVIPPDLRPMVQLDGGRFATSDLNDLYRRVINRNNRLKRLLDLGAPEIIVNNEKRMLQEAVDALFDNGRRGRPVTGPGNRPLKSISDMLKGKQGRFRQNLLGKRVDYSGRSVIVVGPELKLHQCGLPKVMALELFKPFVMKRLVDLEHAQNIKSAKRMVDRGKPVVWDVLEEIIRDHPVLLNRAPTLHRLGIQAFEPILVEGKAIRIHPLVCTAFNADFDGDQMAVHLPLSAEAQAEARILMLSVNNIKSPAHGRPLATPTQDMVMGIYYLTAEREGVLGEGRAFFSFDEAILAYDNRSVDLQAKIQVRLTEDLVEEVAPGKLVEHTAGERLETTVGRITFNRSLPDDYPFVNREVDKKGISRIVEDCSNRYETTKMARILDEVKRLGFHYATRAGVTVSVYDIKVPEAKTQLLADADETVEKIEKQYENGLITKDERHRQVVDVWTKTTEDVGEAMAENFDKFNPVYMMAYSGARGNIKQIRQLAGMRGLMANPKGEILDRPIKANFREGLSVLEYFISTHGARKGLADTALRTADSGYLTRRLVDVAQDVIVRSQDCETDEGVVFPILDPKQPGKVDHDLVGRCLLTPVAHPKTGEVVKDAGEYIGSDQELIDLDKLGIETIECRTVMTCHAKHGICQSCYGWDLASGRAVDIGTAVGIIAAQSIGEPGTQLTMRTFHTGGVAGEDITHGLPRVTELFEARKPKGQAQLAEIAGKLSIEDGEKTRRLTITGSDAHEKSYTVSRRARLRPGIVDGAAIETGTQMTEGSVNPHDLLHLRGPKDVLSYIVAEVQEVYASQGVDINDKHIEVIARQMMRKVSLKDAGDTEFLPGQLVDRFAFREAAETALADGKEPGSAEDVLLGITKASLATDSYLSAASFQETTRVLTDAAIAGKEDQLLGLKENVIIGKLIPAATGMKRYRSVKLTYKGQSAEWPDMETTEGALPDFAPEELKQLEAMLPTPQAIAEASGLTEEEATAFFADLDTANVEAVDFGAMLPDTDAFDTVGPDVDRGGPAGEKERETEPQAEPAGRQESDGPGAQKAVTAADVETVADDQCHAMTGTGAQCRNKALEGSRYCKTHEKNAETDGMCKGHYADGRPCKSRAKEGSYYCGVHGKDQ